MDNNFKSLIPIPIQLDSKKLWPRYIFRVSVQCDLDLGEMTSGQRHDAPLSNGQQLCDISRSNLAVRSYGPDTDFGYECTVKIDLGDMTLGAGHDTPLGHGQQLCEILSRSNMAVKLYGPDTLFLVFTVTLTLKV